jgi:hypothetical protein
LPLVGLGCFGVCNMSVGVGWCWLGAKWVVFWCEVSRLSAGDEGCRVWTPQRHLGCRGAHPFHRLWICGSLVYGSNAHQLVGVKCLCTPAIRHLLGYGLVYTKFFGVWHDVHQLSWCTYTWTPTRLVCTVKAHHFGVHEVKFWCA